MAESGSDRIAVFAYGSLVDPASASQSLDRPVGNTPLARLAGWRRRFSLARDNLTSEKSFALPSDGSLPPFVLSLNIERAPGSVGPNGALIEVSEPELARLDLREMRYDRVEVTDMVVDDHGGGCFDLVYAYTAKPANTAPDPPPGAVVLATYVEAVESAFAALGEDQRRLYLETTEAAPVAVVEGTLVSDRIPPGNPRDW